MLGNERDEVLYLDDSNAENIMNQRNHCKQMEEYWVFGSTYKTDKFETLFSVADCREDAVLLSIIQRELSQL